VYKRTDDKKLSLLGKHQHLHQILLAILKQHYWEINHTNRKPYEWLEAWKSFGLKV
jgi:hypothetical protein